MSFGSGTGFGGFGNTNQQQSSGGFGGFGGSTAGNTGFGSTNTGFGATNTAGSSLFGGSTAGTTGFGGGFGATNNSNNNTNNASPFGAAKPAFGASTTTTGGGLFGGNNTSTSGTGFGGGFGGGNTAAAPAFGSPAATGTGMFGSAAAKPGFGAPAAGTSLFGSGTNNTTGGFGAANTGTSGFGGGGFGASAQQTPQNNGTAATPFAAHVEKDAASSTNSHYQSITFQQPYQGFSFEELRLADYNAGRRYGNTNGQPGAFGTNTGFGGFGGTQPAATGTTGFGAANNTGTSLFGGNNANNTNATQSPFGQSSAPATGFGNTNSGGLFGAPKPATGGLFGNTSAASNGTTGGNMFGTGNTTTSTAGTGFGGGFGSGTATAAPGTSLFGNAAQPNKPFGNTGFGSTGTTGGFGSGTTGSTGGFGQTGTSTGGGLFGGNQQPATGGGLFGSNNTQQPQQQNTGTGLFNSGGGFGQNNTQPQTSGAGGGLFNAFGQNNQQNQQKPAGLSFGGSTGIGGGGGLFGAANNQQQQQQPAAGSSPFGQPNNQQQNTGGGLFGAQKPSTGGLFGSTPGSTSTGAGVFGGQNNQQQNTGGSLFGGNNQQQNTGGSLFGGNNNNNSGQKPSLFGNSLGGGLGNSTNNTGGGSLFGGNSGQQPGVLGQSINQQQGQNQLAATLLSNPYGNDQLFQNLGTPSAPVGPLATPLAGAQKSTKKPTPLPQFKINPTASLRLITTPQKRSNGYGFSYQTYGTPGSAQSFTSNGLGSSLLQSGGLSRSLGKSFSTNNLRGNLSPEGDSSSVLAPGAFTPNSRPYAGGSIRRLKIDRNLRTDLFGDGSASEPSSLNKKRVSFSKDTGKASASNGLSALPDSAPSNALIRTEPEGIDDPESSALPPARSTANGTRSNGTPLRQELNGNGLDMVPEDETAPATARSVANDLPKSHTDQTPGTYWMSPSLRELRNMSREQLKKVHGFKVGRNGIGRIEFDDVDLTTVPLDDVCDNIVKLNHRSATVYATDADTPTPGKGLNVPSTIILENSWPRAYAGKVPVHERKGPRFDKHLERLKRVENTEFISYDPETGIWIFRVQHFTTYGLDDEEDDDAEYTMETEQQDPTPKANVEIAHQDEASEISAEESTPDDTFDFKKGPSKSLPGGFDGGQSIYADEDMADETDAQDDNSSFLEQRGMSMLEDPFRSSGSGSAAALAVQADERPMDKAVPEQDMAGSFPEPESQNKFGASLMPKSILKNSMLFGPGTPKKNLALTGDWAEQLQRTVSPKKQDRQALRERQASVMGVGAIGNAPFAASIAGKAFNTTMDIMNSLWQPAASTSGSPLKNSAGGKGFEWPYAKRPKIDDAFTDMNESDRAFHSSFKPSWTTNNTLVYAIPGSAPSVSGNMAAAKRSIVSEGKDVRFARFAPEISTASALQVQMAQIVVSEVDGIPAAQTAHDISFAALADSVTQTTIQGRHERAVWKLASILFDPLTISCSALTQGLAEHEVARLEHRIRRDALSLYWSELVRDDAATAARDAATAEEKAFAFLTGNNIEEACAALVDGKNLRLATIIAQLPGNSTMREMMRKQVDAWRSQNILSEMPEPIRALYELTAGNLCVSEGKTGAVEDRAPTFNISSRFSLDWRRSFGLRLWFGDNDTESLAEAVHAYGEDVASGKETARPTPFFTEQSLSTTWKDLDSEAREDTLFGLLKLYARKPTAVDAATIIDFLAPASISGNPLDARLAWQLSVLLRSKGVISPADVTDETLDALGLSLATQLEANNELFEALKVLLHLTGSAERETFVRSMLYRRAPDLFAASDSNSLPARLTDEVKIPSAWLWHARALCARSLEEDHVAEATYLLRAGAYDESHNVLCRIVGPQAVISQDYDRLRELFGGFDGLTADVKIEGWDIGGLVYSQYIHLLDLEGRYGEQQVKEKKVVLERMAKILPRMLAVRHRGRVDLEERVAVGLMSSTVKAESEKIGREEQIGFGKGRLDALPTAGDGYAKEGLELSATFYKAIAT